MDCEKLQEDIRELKALRDKFSARYIESIETGRGKTALSDICNEAIKSTDEKLKKYLPDFIKEYREVFSLQISEKIEGFKDATGLLPSDIRSMLRLGDDEALIGGDRGVLYYARRDETDHWRLDYKIVAPTLDATEDILAISFLPDGSILAGGTRGCIFHIDKNEDGRWIANYDFNQLFLNTPGLIEEVTSISPLSDGGALVGGGGETLYYASKGPDGRWRLDYMIKGVSFNGKISAITPLFDESVLVGSTDGGMFCHLIKGEDKKWIIDDSFQLLSSDLLPRDKTIVSIFSLPDGSTVALDADGFLLEIVKNSDSHWRIDKKVMLSDVRIDDAILLPDGSIVVSRDKGGDIVRYVKSFDGYWLQVDRLMVVFKGLVKAKMLSLKNGEWLAGGRDGGLFYIKKPKKDLETLKKNLDRIVDASTVDEFSSR